MTSLMLLSALFSISSSFGATWSLLEVAVLDFSVSLSATFAALAVALALALLTLLLLSLLLFLKIN